MIAVLLPYLIVACIIIGVIANILITIHDLDDWNILMEIKNGGTYTQEEIERYYAKIRR